jgi:hypothetical protein
MFDFVSYRNQLKASRMTGGIVPHPAVRLLQSPLGFSMTTPWSVCAVGQPAEPAMPAFDFCSAAESHVPASSPAFPPLSFGIPPAAPSFPVAPPRQHDLGLTDYDREEIRRYEERMRRPPEPWVEIENVWTEYNARCDGREGMLIHTEFSSANLWGEGLQAIAFFYYDDTVPAPVESQTAGFRTQDGDLCVSARFSPSFQRSVYRDFQLFLPLETLHFRNCGVWNFKYVVVVRSTEPYWTEFARSPWQRFEFRVQPRAAFRDVWMEHNVWRGGDKGMVIHAAFEIHNSEEREFQAIAFFHSDEARGEPIPTDADGFRTTDKGLCVSKLFTPPYQFTEFEDFQLFLPYWTVPSGDLRGRGLKFYIAIRAQDGTSAPLIRSGWQRFRFT